MTITFEEAREQPKLRQSFLDSLDLEGARPFIKRVVYINPPIRRKFEGYQAQCTTPIGFHFGIPGCRSTISIYPDVFSGDLYQNEDDLRSTLIDHEGHHAKEMFNNLASVNSARDYLRVLYPNSRLEIKKRFYASEQRAIHNQISNFPRRDCSLNFIANIIAQQAINEINLTLLQKLD